MKKTCLIFVLAISLVGFKSAVAQQINTQLACDSMLAHIEGKLPALSNVYDKDRLNTIKHGVISYRAYFKNAHIDKALTAYTDDVLQQIEGMREAMKTGLDSRFAESRFYSDNAMALENCRKSFAPNDPSTHAKVTSMVEEILRAARQN